MNTSRIINNLIDYSGTNSNENNENRQAGAVHFSLDNLLQVCRLLPSKNLAPYFIIKYIADNALDNGIKAALEEIDMPFQENNKDLITSCFSTVNLIAAILLDKKTKEATLDHMFNFEKAFKCEIELPSGKLYAFFIYALFDGEIMRFLIENHCFSNQTFGQLLFDALSPVNTFNQKMKSEIQGLAKYGLNDEACLEYLAFRLENNQFNFNKKMLNDLQLELDETIPTENESKIYFLTISLPKNDNTELICYHTCAIEQFSLNGQTHYRLYQSWRNQITLAENCASNAPWTRQELDVFLDKFRRFIGGSIEITAKDVFGCVGNSYPLITFKNNILAGLLFKYIAVSFDPAKVIDNVLDFVTRNPQLGSQLGVKIPRLNPLIGSHMFNAQEGIEQNEIANCQYKKGI